MAYTPDPERVTYFGATHTRGKHSAFGIRAKDRDKHMYVIGKSGMGKSTLLENMAIQDIQNGEGLAFIDPHGATAEKLLDFVPQERMKDVLYFAPFDTDYPIGFNVMEDVGYDKRHLVVSGLMGAFHRIWQDAWSARMEYILSNTLLALLEYPDSTLLDVNRMLVNKAFRQDVIEHITDPIVKAFWAEEFAGYSDRYTQDATPAIQNKIGQFVSNPLVRNIVGQPQSTFNLREMMDDRKILIVNLSKGRMGETNASLLGSMMVVKLYLTAMSRADEPGRSFAPFYFYVDEFQSVVNEAFANILSEARKYKLCLTIANQYIEQMDEVVRAAVFGNVGTTIMFRVGPFDAEFLKTVFEPTFLPEDMVNLGIGQIYLTLMIDGVGSQPFSAQTLPPIETPPITFTKDILANSRVTYGKEQSVVNEIIQKRQNTFVEANAKNKKAAQGGFKPAHPPKNNASGGGSQFGGGGDRPPRNDQRDDRPNRSQGERSRPESQPQRAPEPSRSPAEILRAQRPEKQQKPSFPERKSEPVKPAPAPRPSAAASNPLKDAIKAAVGDAAPTPQTSKKKQPNPKPRSSPDAGRDPKSSEQARIQPSDKNTPAQAKRMEQRQDRIEDPAGFGEVANRPPQSQQRPANNDRPASAPSSNDADTDDIDPAILRRIVNGR